LSPDIPCPCNGELISNHIEPNFFFSSRRRHTRFSRDWSSDVCSSDLCHLISYLSDEEPLEPGTVLSYRCSDCNDRWDLVWEPDRSEERRVGKECRSRCTPAH